jgi:hypothetical protein
LRISSRKTTSAARLRPAPAQRFPDDREQLVVGEQPIGVPHPKLVEIGEVFGEERLEQATLTVAQSRHLLFYRELRQSEPKMFCGGLLLPAISPPCKQDLRGLFFAPESN